MLSEHHQRIAALVIEPLVQCAAGIIVHPPGYLRGVRELCTKYDVLLIADEVAVGFGRTGKMFACEHEQVTPDFLCLAKGITGGYLPLAATLTTDEIWNAFLGTYAESKSFFHGHTYGGNPLGAAVALGESANLRRRANAENNPAKDRAAQRTSRAHRAAQTRRRRATVRPDRRRRTGARQSHQRTVSLGRAPRLASLRIRNGRRRVCSARWAMSW